MAVEFSAPLTEALVRFGRPEPLACDHWREAELYDALDRAGVPRAAVETGGQGLRDGGEDVRDFHRAGLENRVRLAVSLLLQHAMGEARVVMEPAGNAKLAKNSDGGRRVRARDDAAAAILAVAAGSWLAGRPQRRHRRHAVVG